MFELPKLNYDYVALEPYIDAKTMEVHYSKHHAGYVKKLNGVLERAEKYRDLKLRDLLVNLERLPREIREGVRNNGGGHFNHSFFWKVMAKDGGKPSGDLAEAIKRDFGSLERLKEEFSEAAMTRFGSGWAWLSVAGEKLRVESTANQDSPLTEGREPILGLDVWEHAYYLKYQNRRDEYVKNWWQVVNWEQVVKNYEAAS